MNIILRGVAPQYLKEIDRKTTELKNKTGKNWSRNDYLLQLIREDSELDLIEYRKLEYDIAVEKMLASNENLTKTNKRINIDIRNAFQFPSREDRLKDDKSKKSQFEFRKFYTINLKIILI